MAQLFLTQYRFLTNENVTLTPIRVISDYVSLIWTTRATTHGDFQLILAATGDAAQDIRKNDFLRRSDDGAGLDRSGDMMIVEQVRIELAEDGQYRKIVTGRSMMALWARRITKSRFGVANPSVDGLASLVRSNSTSGDEVYLFPYGQQVTDVDTQIDQTIVEAGTNVLELFTSLCEKYGYTFRGEWRFGALRPFAQYFTKFNDSSLVLSETNGMVQSYSLTTEVALKTSRMMVGGQQEENPANRIFATINWVSAPKPFDKVDQYIDGSSIRRDTGMSESDYRIALSTFGKQQRNTMLSDVQLDLDTSALVLPRDLALGQSARVETRAFTARVRLMEIIDSVSEDGAFTQTPTFAII